MFRTLILTLTIIVISQAETILNLQLGELTINNSTKQGLIPLICSSDTSNKCELHIVNTPPGWTVSSNVISVPDILNVNGEFLANVIALDEANNYFVGEIKIGVYGRFVKLISQSSFLNRNVTEQSLLNLPSSISQDPSITKLYQTYQGLRGTEKPQLPPSGKYQIPSFLSGTPEIPTISQTVIANSQAQYVDSRDAKQFTLAQIKRNAAFARQINANKAVANLVAIISQISIQANDIFTQIGSIQEYIKTIEANSSACTEKATDLQNNITLLKESILKKHSTLMETNKTISELGSTITTLTNGRTDNLLKSQALRDGTKSTTERVAQLSDEAQKSSATVQGYQKKINDLNLQISAFNDGIAKAQSVINMSQQNIDMLNKTSIQGVNLQERKRILDEKIKQQEIIDTANRDIRNFKIKAKDLSSRIPSLVLILNSEKSRLNNTNKIIEFLKTEVAGDLKDAEAASQQALTKEKQLKDQNNQVNSLKETLQALINQLGSLNFDRAQKEQEWRRKQEECSRVGESLQKANKDRQDLILTLKAQSDLLNQANANLEKAKAEKKLADDAVVQIVQATNSTNIGGLGH